MADPLALVSALTAVTREEIWPRQVTDNFFKAIPFFSYLRDKAIMDWDGGTYMQYPFLYNALMGGAYAPGSSFNIDKVDTLSALQFREKYYEDNITHFLEEIEVRNRGANAVFSLLDTDMRNAMMTITTQIAIAAWRHGQVAGGTAATVLDDRSLEINGLSEALNDGTVYSWDGNIFTVYGGQQRNGYIGAALNSVPRWMGTANGSPGKITYEVLEDMYQTASQGNLSPDLAVTSKRGMTLIKNTLQVQQRFAQETEPRYGFEGIRLNKMLITKDDYAPSAAPSAGGFGVNDPRLGNYLTGTITNGLTGTPAGNFPNSTNATTLTVAEVIFMLNTDSWIFRVSTSPLYQFGWTGFKPAQDNTMVSGQVLAAVNLECISNRLNIHGFGFNS
jgi:hypothetical protein